MSWYVLRGRFTAAIPYDFSIHMAPEKGQDWMKLAQDVTDMLIIAMTEVAPEMRHRGKIEIELLRTEHARAQ